MDLSFVKEPKKTINLNNSFNKKTKELFITLLFMFVSVAIISIATKWINLYVTNLTDFSFLDDIKHEQSIITKKMPLFIPLFIAPFLEELIFRLPLKLTLQNIRIALFILAFYFIGGNKILILNWNNFNTWVKFFCMLLIGYFLAYLIKQKRLNQIDSKYYTIYFYVLPICFGLMHISNFGHLVPKELLFLCPIFVTPHIITGCFYSYIRIRNGFLWGVTLHCFYNLSIFLIFYFQNQNV